MVEVRIRSVEPGDLPVFFEQQADPVAAEMAAFPPRERTAFDAHWATLLADTINLQWTVLADDVVVGNVLAFYGGPGREVGYWIGREHWGRGIATAALSLVLEELDERPLFGVVAAHNAASIRVLEKCGFVRRGGPDTPAHLAEDGIYEVVLELR